VEAEILDHKLPVLAFRIQEAPPFDIDFSKLANLGLLPGDWIRDLKSRVWKGTKDIDIRVIRQNGATVRSEKIDDPAELYRLIKGEKPCSSIGYLSDTGWTIENRKKIEDFFKDITLLCTECTFLAADSEKARASYHFCTDDLNELTAVLKPRWLLPMHLSKSYLHRTVDLYSELKPPEETTLLKLPNHLVSAPLKTNDVEKWLRQTTANTPDEHSYTINQKLGNDLF
jgi:ribonuclease Z